MKTYPLTRTQMGIYLAGQNAQGNEDYNIVRICRLGADVELARFRQALGKVFDNHAAFKARLVAGDEGMPCFTYDAGEAAQIQELEMSSAEELEQKATAFQFDLSGGPLYQLWIVHVAEDGSCWFAYVIHHLIFDGVSNAIFFRELQQAYHGKELMPEAKTIFDICLDEVEERKSEAYAAGKAYYSSTFADAEDVVTYPSEDVAQPTVPVQEQWGNIEVPLGVDRSAVKAMCSRYNVATDMVFYAAFGYVMSRMCNDDKALFATIYKGRPTEETSNTMAMLVQTYPIFIDFSGNASTGEALARLSDQARATRQHTIYSFGEAVLELGVKPMMSISYHGTLHDSEWVVNEESLHYVHPVKHAPGFNLSFAVVQVGNDYRIRVFHNRNLHTADYIRNICLCIGNVLSQMAEGKDFADMQLLNDGQTAQVMALSQGEQMEYDTTKTPVGLIMEYAQSTPDAIAVADADTSLTYAQLDSMTNALAHVLIDNGVQRDQYVGVMTDRSVRFPVAAFAIHKAGAAYMPLDVDYPNERLSYMIENSEATVLLTTHAVLEAKQAEGGLNTEGLHIIYLDDEADSHSQADPICLATPDSLAYMIYTSGSTGKPKGAMLHQRGLLNFTLSISHTEQLTASDRIASHRSFSFDAHIGDLYPILAKGGSLHIMPSEIRKDLDAMYRFIVDNRITGFGCTTSLMMLMLGSYDMPLRFVTAGGEKLSGVQSDHIRIINLYGPTECTNDSTLYVIEPGQKVANIPIGRPLHNMTCLVMSKDGKLLPQGAPGELCIAGVQVGNGYWRLPEKTAEAFVDSPLAASHSRKLYRTGDLVRWNAEGQLEYLGRIDGQVKLRGFRIEMGEIESTVLQLEGVKQAAAAVREVGGNKRLVLYYTLADGATVTGRDVSAHVESSTLADYMHPEIYQLLDVMPQLPNGKIDRKHLPTPDMDMQEAEAEAPGQLNILEQKLVQMVASLIGVETLGINTSLRRYGMSSLVSMKLAAQLFKQYGVNIKGKELATGSIADIENVILEKMLGGSATADVDTRPSDERQSPAPASPSPKVAPLSFTQQGVYSDCMANAGGIQYNIPKVLAFPEGVTAQRVREALMQMLDAHPYMKCHFLTDDNGDVVQQPMENLDVDVPVVKMTAAECEAYRKEFVKPFDINKGPLFRFEICEVEDRVVLFADIHHLISDGFSANMLYHQLCQALDGQTIAGETYDYYDFVRDQTLDATADEYFDQTIGGVEEVSRLLPDVFEEGLPHRQRTVSAAVPACDIDARCRQLGVTPAAFFLAASALTVSRYLCEEDITMTTISNGRSNLKIYDTVGMFVGTLPLALHVGTADTTDTLLGHASRVFDAAIDHESYPFARVAKKYGFMPQISYACQMGVAEELHTKEGKVRTESLDLDIAKVPVAIYANGSFDDGVTMTVDYDSSLYTEAMMQHFVDAIANVASMLAEKQSVKEISLTTEKEWTLLDSFNSPLFTDYDHTDSVVSLFRKHVERHPDKMAAVFGDKRYTYRQLDEATDRLSHYIYNKVSALTGKTRLSEEVVSIIIDRNEWVFLLPLAVLKTGCAYEPLDPSYPSDRLNYMVQDARASLLIGQEEFIGLVSEYGGEVVTTAEMEKVLASDQPSSSSSLSSSSPSPSSSSSLSSSSSSPSPSSSSSLSSSLSSSSPSPSDLLLMLYTSGSTGKPKGVQIEHHSLVSFAYGIAQADFYTEDCVAAAYASFGFDVCMMDTFCTLLNGGTLVIIPEDMRLELKALAEYMESERVTQIFMTTQVGVQFLQNYPSVKHLRYLGMGGEKLPAVNPEGLSYKILNGYGPTENTCGVSLFPIRHWEPNIPLGRPFPTIQGYVLDKAGHRLPPGACGEYCVAGDQPARGYLGLPEKTAEVFVEYKGMRMYHTGDVVRYRENGDVEFVGRKDGMVKIRGFRIELKEVEAAIRPFPGVTDVTVQAYDYDGGGKYLAAFVVAEREISAEDILAFVKSQKPPYMVPAIVMQIDRIPLTVNQKVDKKALPKPQMAAAAFVAPRNKVEEDFCEIFAEVLGQEKVSAASDFFEIGGSSIIALKVVIAADKRGYSIVYNDVFTYTTPQDMAEHLGAGADESDSDEAKPASETTTAGTEAEVMEDENASFYGPGTREVGPDGYDYRAINALLRGNTLEAFLGGESQPIGDVLLTGATGYLGIHVLKDLIDNYTGRIYCFVRAKGGVSAENRLRHLLFYYFDNDYSELFPSGGNTGARLFIVEGDATDPRCLDGFDKSGLTVINCAACVKHFSKGNEIEEINVGSVRNLVAWCLRSGSRLVHVSTGSVMGVSVDNVPPRGFRFNESMLYVGQGVEGSQYTHSKFIAERVIYEAILHDGLNAKVMRVGNLAPRDRDGEFQINFKSNNFTATLAAYSALGVIPYEGMDAHVEFSPIDYVARSILLLSTTPSQCVCFMPSNQHRPLMGDILMQLEPLGYPMRMAEREEFQKAVQEALNNPAKVDKMRPLMAYKRSSSKNTVRPLGFDDLDVSYTVQVLYRHGFRWPDTSDDYVRRFLTVLSGFDFFE